MVTRRNRSTLYNINNELAPPPSLIEFKRGGKLIPRKKKTNTTSVVS